MLFQHTCTPCPIDCMCNTVFAPINNDVSVAAILHSLPVFAFCLGLPILRSIFNSRKSFLLMHHPLHAKNALPIPLQYKSRGLIGCAEKRVAIYIDMCACNEKNFLNHRWLQKLVFGPFRTVYNPLQVHATTQVFF